jgi:hypothetical protein
MTNERIIEAKVVEFMASGKMFTSVDIANSIKKDKVWIRNSEVAAYLRKNAIAMSAGQYDTVLTVVANNHKAHVYFPNGTDPDTYIDTDQVALTPQDVGVDLLAIDKIKLEPDVRNRLRIPASLVKELGLNPGDCVANDKILVNNKDISEKLEVQSDGRIEISRECSAWGNDPVYAFVRDNVLCFERA